MQTIEFNATIENGVIPIPESCKNKIPNRVKVILTEDVSVPRNIINFDELVLDTKGYKFNREEANDWWKNFFRYKYNNLCSLSAGLNQTTHCQRDDPDK